MSVCDEWMRRIKPGGTAGVGKYINSCPCNSLIVWDESFLFCQESLWTSLQNKARRAGDLSPDK